MPGHSTASALTNMGDPRCPCLPSLESFGVAAGTNLTLVADNTAVNYGPLYGLQSCQVHDLHRLPWCGGPSSKTCDEQPTAQGPKPGITTFVGPSFCFEYWCYVNRSNCLNMMLGKRSMYNWSQLALQDPRDELGFSYTTCNACDFFSGSSKGEAPSQGSSNWTDTHSVLVAVSYVLIALLICGAMRIVILRRTKAKRSERMRRMRLVADHSGALAEELAPGHLYHLFLSHVWSTGADRMNMLKVALGLAVPTLKVFLDIDDMEEGRGLEYVDQSECVVLFLSDGYVSAAAQPPVLVEPRNDP